MPRDPVIVDQKVVIPATRELNNYGDLIFTDGDGHQHKMGNKREHLFDSIIIGKAVELYYAVYMDKKYICGAKLVDGALPPPKSDKKVLPEHQKEIDRAQGARDSDVIAPQEIGMWFKEVGELYRLGLISKNTPEGLALMTIYFARMKRALGLEVVKKPAPKKVEPEPELEPDDVPF